MTDVNLITKDSNVNPYIVSLEKGIKLCNGFNLLDSSLLTLLLNKISLDLSKGSTIHRDDLLKFGDNVEIIIGTPELIAYFKVDYAKLLNSGRSGLEIAYEIVSIIDRLASDYQKEQLEKEKREKDQQRLEELRMAEENAKVQRLTELENLLDQL